MKYIIVLITLLFLVSIHSTSQVRDTLVFVDYYKLKNIKSTDSVMSDVESYFRDSLNHAIISIDSILKTDNQIVMEIGDTITVLFFLTLKKCKYPVDIHHEVKIINPSVTSNNRSVMEVKSFVVVDVNNARSTRLIRRNGKSYARQMVYKRLRKDVLKRNDLI